MFFRPDCLHFLGNVPCRPHKDHGYHCTGCPVYRRVGKRILIIKLGAMGDVVRTTPLVTRFRALYPDAKITWVTEFPEILPRGAIDEVLKLGTQSTLYVSNTDWDIAVNLDKEKEAAALLKMVSARQKFGFVLRDGVTQPVNALAEHKFRTGLFDDDSKANTRSYCAEIFEICGLQYDGEPYLLDKPAAGPEPWDLPRDRPLVGLNTGCGDRWTTRLWSEGNWVALARGLVDAGFQPLLLGGAQEHGRNLAIQGACGALYPGHFPLQRFMSLVDECDLVVTQVTMALHLALGLGKKVVLMNNIFNRHEFDLGRNGLIVQPDRPCDCYYRGTCKHGTSCMETLQPRAVLAAVRQLMQSA